MRAKCPERKETQWKSTIRESHSLTPSFSLTSCRKEKKLYGQEALSSCRRLLASLFRVIYCYFYFPDNMVLAMLPFNVFSVTLCPNVNSQGWYHNNRQRCAKCPKSKCFLWQEIKDCFCFKSKSMCALHIKLH